MTDIFREVEEDVRRERFAQLWKQYGDYIITVGALVVIAVAGFQLWRIYDQRQHLRASDAYVVAQQLLQAGQANEAASMFARLAKNAPGGYAAVARLQEADALTAAGNRVDAMAIYREIVASNDPYLSAIARIHLGWAIVDQSSKNDVATLLAPLDEPAGAWQPMAREILAYADYRAGDVAEATRGYESLAADGKAPDDLRQRSKIMAGFLKAGGDRDYGSVPHPPRDKLQHAPSNASAGGSASK